MGPGRWQLGARSASTRNNQGPGGPPAATPRERQHRARGRSPAARQPGERGTRTLRRRRASGPGMDRPFLTSRPRGAGCTAIRSGTLQHEMAIFAWTTTAHQQDLTMVRARATRAVQHLTTEDSRRHPGVLFQHDRPSAHPALSTPCGEYPTKFPSTCHNRNQAEHQANRRRNSALYSGKYSLMTGRSKRRRTLSARAPAGMQTIREPAFPVELFLGSAVGRLGG
jgi:hypothetical protein